MRIITTGSWVKDKKFKDIKIVKRYDSHGIILLNFDNVGQIYYSPLLEDKFLAYYELYTPKQEEVNAINDIDTYNKAPEMYWFKTDSKISFETYINTHKYGDRYVGYLIMPEDSFIEKYDLEYVGKGDYDWYSALNKT